jgi:hypothetical protein
MGVGAGLAATNRCVLPKGWKGNCEADAMIDPFCLKTYLYAEQRGDSSRNDCGLALWIEYNLGINGYVRLL